MINADRLGNFSDAPKPTGSDLVGQLTFLSDPMNKPRTREEKREIYDKKAQLFLDILRFRSDNGFFPKGIEIWENLGINSVVLPQREKTADCFPDVSAILSRPIEEFPFIEFKTNGIYGRISSYDMLCQILGESDYTISLIDAIKQLKSLRQNIPVGKTSANKPIVTDFIAEAVYNTVSFRNLRKVYESRRHEDNQKAKPSNTDYAEFYDVVQTLEMQHICRAVALIDSIDAKEVYPYDIDYTKESMLANGDPYKEFQLTLPIIRHGGMEGSTQFRFLVREWVENEECIEFLERRDSYHDTRRNQEKSA